MGIAEVVTVLFAKHLNFNPNMPEWENRDRFILSAGHGSMLIYSLLYLLGYPKSSLENIKKFRKLNSPTAGHPEYNELPGIETTTGPLGQGLGNGLGMAISEEILRSKYGKDIFNHFTFILAGDGCLMEGISHEFASLAGHLKLSNLIVLYDDNKISIDGPTSITMSDNTIDRFKSMGWHTLEVDGYDINQINDALTEAKVTLKPSFISCKTIIGFGSPAKQGTAATHGAPLGEEEIKKAKLARDWNLEKFHVPPEVLNFWKRVGARNIEKSQVWKQKHTSKVKKIKGAATDFTKKIKLGKEECVKLFLSQNSNIASRKASEIVLSIMDKKELNLLGGSADLTGSNNTYVESMKKITNKNFNGSYVHWGVREHCMAAAMNGIALHGFFIPYGGTFLVFSDYCRPAIRLSALMKKRVIYVFTHDSIGLGEDGPTHQPVEHLAALRVMPNVTVYRPCDAIETAECWELALLNEKGPSVLALSRQNLKLLRDNSFNVNKNYCEQGGYALINYENQDLNIIASGSEVQIAVEVAEELIKEKIKVNVISMPSMELFDNKDDNYKNDLINSCKNIFIEAGSKQSWYKWMTDKDIFIGLDSFGVSGPGKEVFDHFGISVEKVLNEARKLLNI
jgi:transketolase